jgi:hypothetical protein
LGAADGLGLTDGLGFAVGLGAKVGLGLLVTLASCYANEKESNVNLKKNLSNIKWITMGPKIAEVKFGFTEATARQTAIRTQIARSFIFSAHGR